MSKKKNRKAYQTPTLTPMVQKVVSVNIRPPAEWPDAKRRLYINIECSLLDKPEFRHLTVLPPGCIDVVTQLVPANDAQVAAVA